MLALSIAFQSLKTVGWRNAQVPKFSGSIQHRHLSGRCLEQTCREPLSGTPFHHSPGQFAFGVLDHGQRVSRHDTSIKKLLREFR